MRLWKQVRTPRRDHPLPAELYISFVDSLYSDSRTLFVGSIAAIIIAFITAWKSGEIRLLGFALAMIAVLIARAVDLRAYASHRPNLRRAEDCKRWEIRYGIGATVFYALLGTWVFVAFATTHDPYVHLLSFSAALGYMVGISGRNFASRQLVLAQIIAAGVPLTAALLSFGDAYHAIFAFVVLVPFILSLKFMADRLRRILVDAVVATRDVSLLASRFDTALNNMPHGLCMLDADQRVVVANKRLSELLGIRSDGAHKGLSLRELLRQCARAGVISAPTVERIAADLEGYLSGDIDSDLTVEVRDGRTLALTFHPMENGGSVVLVEDITERKNAEAKISHLARYDALTGLPNRIFFREQLDRTLALTRRSGHCALMFVDLDQFKQVNDTLGHRCGDAVLSAVADRLRAIVRESDIVARFGGDEFVILQAPVWRREEVDALAKRVVEAISLPYEIDVHQIVIGASVGIALAPEDGDNADTLLKNADMALYRAKAEGRAAWRFFEPEMDAQAQARRSLELDLRDAVSSGAFDVYYQPLINLKTHRIGTCEALLRWPHPTRGMVPPVEFIQVAEEMGLIVEIGNWVLHQACAECMKWPDNVRVAVNLSPIQFRRGDVVAVIRHALAASGLPANRLEIEITESSLLEDTEATRATLQELRDFGVRISLDDFGTGHSSLSYLHNFPLHKVKIDRSFLEGIEANGRSFTLLSGVARLSAELGMCVVVEGIETEEQLALVTREKNIDEAQGYLFSPAIPSGSIRKLLVAMHAGPQFMIEKIA
ncbi:MAG TPA: EAL domain-containing protein [Casimicrobiaceae bacterium]|nr:EAL domain-containing protein [Casimicrobiaceae bacterium]